ncbi:MAG: hypothetical protein NTX87_02535 [Planctomycetota bacterium]|nr:hypothetical protein [Planctomycetota bacterium]
MTSLTKTVVAVALVLGAVTAARADIGAFSVPTSASSSTAPAAASEQISTLACLDSGVSDVLLPAGLAAVADPMHTPGRLPEEPASLSLVLAGLGSLGAWQLGRAARTAHFGHVPDWFHAGGPMQVGHTFIANPDCTAVLEICSFDHPAGEHRLLHRLRCDPPPIHQPQCILVTESPRGPPLLFS